MRVCGRLGSRSELRNAIRERLRIPETKQQSLAEAVERKMGDSKSDIVMTLLKDAPPGQAKEVFADVRTLVGDDALVAECAERAFAAANLENFAQASYSRDSEDSSEGKQSKFLISKHGDLGSGDFLDPRTKSVVAFNHVELKCSNVRPAPAALECEATRSHRERLEAAVLAYAEETYPEGTASVYAPKGKGPGGAGDLVACIASCISKPASFWSGRWTSEWTVSAEFEEEGSGKVRMKAGTCTLKGKCAVHTHYYENGNVQFRSSREFSPKIAAPQPKDGDAAASLAAAIVKAVAEAEAGYQDELQDSLRDFSDTTFKDLRRQLPITQVTFPWKSGAASLASELNRKMV